jgi:hypothetical protein
MIKNNEEHVEALFLYSKLSTLCGKHDNALSLLLRCVVKKQDDKVSLSLSFFLHFLTHSLFALPHSLPSFLPPFLRKSNQT